MEIENNRMMMTTRRYALLLAAHDSEYVKKVYGGYFNVFVDAFGDGGEIWDLYRVVDGHFPELSDVDIYHGFVVSGSPFDAFGEELWILKLCLLLQTLHSIKKKVLGICFGHQVICRALGGKVRRSPTGWDIGIREIRLNNVPYQLLSSNDDDDHDGNDDDDHDGDDDDDDDDDDDHDDDDGRVRSTSCIIECHQDEVWEVPLNAKIVGNSEKTSVEMLTIGNHIMGIQGHPEYTKDILYNLLHRLLSDGTITEEFAEVTRSKIEKIEADREYWLRICKKFLKEKQSFCKELYVHLA